MYDRSEFLDVMRKARTSTIQVCDGFQRDLSALLDNELPEDNARRAASHLEDCSGCEEFFQAIRLQALAHRDMAIPGSLSRRLRRMRGQDLFEGMADSEIIRRMAASLYQLGKAYALAATDGGYLIRVSEDPVEIRSFEEGELTDAAEAAEATGACQVSRDVLESQSENHLARGRRLIQESLRLKPKFAEARLYLGYIHQVSGDLLSAEREYHEVFLRTDRLQNRGHAAIQLGMLCNEKGDHRRALRIYRWVMASGLVHRNPDFAFVLYNVAVQHVALGNLSAAVQILRRLQIEFPFVWEKARTWFRQSSHMFTLLQGDPESRRLLEEAEPSLFAA